MKTLPEATEALLAAAHALADAATELNEDENAGAEDWGPLRAALEAFHEADLAQAEARDREAKARELGETLSARLAKLLGDIERVCELGADPERNFYDLGGMAAAREALSNLRAELVAEGGSTFEREFLADVLLPDGRTVHEVLAGQLEDSYRDGGMPKLLGSGS